MTCIRIYPRVDGTGGGASFRRKFEHGLRSRGIDVTYDLNAQADATLVLAGTRSLLPLYQLRQRGHTIVQRLDGINWVHRKRNTGLKHYLRAEYGNFILRFIRRNIATKVIYQSEFVRNWWEDWYGETRIPNTVIHNGVDLETYSVGQALSPTPPFKLLLVEGSLGGGYEMGLDNAIELTELLNTKYNLPVELTVAGKITDQHKAAVQARTKFPIQFLGSISQERIIETERASHLFFSADLHPACPNAVIEALACGLPVIAFDTGAVKELVFSDAGRVVPYGSNSWNIEKPNIPALAQAAVEILQNQSHFSHSARAHAESALGLDAMVEKYLEFLTTDDRPLTIDQP